MRQILQGHLVGLPGFFCCQHWPVCCGTQLGTDICCSVKQQKVVCVENLSAGHFKETQSFSHHIIESETRPPLGWTQDSVSNTCDYVVWMKLFLENYIKVQTVRFIIFNTLYGHNHVQTFCSGFNVKGFKERNVMAAGTKLRTDKASETSRRVEDQLS